MILRSVLYLVFITGIQCANILIVYDIPRRSHQIWIGELAQALIKKDHNITMAGAWAKSLDASDKYHPIPFEGAFFTDIKLNKSEFLHSTAFQSVWLAYNHNYDICNQTYLSNGFQKLWSYPKDFKFDLIVIDLTMGPCMYPLIHKFGNPHTIGFTPSDITPYLSDMFGNSVSTSNLKFSKDMNFIDRLKNFLTLKFEILFKKYWEKKSLERLAASILNDTFNFNELEKFISLLLVNHYPLFSHPQPLTPNIVPVGGLHLKTPEQLPGILQMILDNASMGFIFFTIGADIQEDIFGVESRQALANGFGQLEQTSVIWKGKVRPMGEDDIVWPSNIIVHKWMPQNDILAHPHMKLIVTTGGLLTIQEAVFHGIPVVSIPIYDDQYENIKFITENNLGLKLDYNNLTKENVFETVNSVLRNPIYAQNMEEVSKKFKDQPHNPLNRAIYWVEYMLRQNESNKSYFFTPKTRNMGSLAVYSLDVELFLVSIFVLYLAFSIYIVLILSKRFYKTKVKSIKNKKKTQ